MGTGGRAETKPDVNLHLRASSAKDASRGSNWFFNILQSEASSASFDFAASLVLFSEHHLSDTKLCQWFRATYPKHRDVCSPEFNPPSQHPLPPCLAPRWCCEPGELGLAFNHPLAQQVTPAAQTQQSFQLLLQTGEGKLSDSNPSSTDTLWVDENRNTGSLTCSKGL